MDTKGKKRLNLALREARQARGWTQKHVAEAIGAPQTFMVNRWENGKSTPSAYYIQKLCEIFEKEPKELGLASLPSSLLHMPSLRDSLPPIAEPFIGREKEIDMACKLLQHKDTRLLTLSGPAGVGKTSLAINVATQLVDKFPDGISFISLVSVHNPSMVASRIAYILGVQESLEQSVLTILKMSLLNTSRLLILDNFEQVMGAASVVTEILDACPTLKILVTSRERMRVRMEYQLIVPPLALPDPRYSGQKDIVLQSPAVALLVERVRAIRPAFQVDEENASALASICARLDGLPLALELVAIHLKILSPQTLLTRLDHRLALLDIGFRDLPERQQTLKKALQWSYELLTNDEQQLFRQLAVFRGCTFTTIEEVCSPFFSGKSSLLKTVTLLVEKNLI